MSVRGVSRFGAETIDPAAQLERTTGRATAAAKRYTRYTTWWEDTTSPVYTCICIQPYHEDHATKGNERPVHPPASKKWNALANIDQARATILNGGERESSEREDITLGVTSTRTAAGMVESSLHRTSNGNGNDDNSSNCNSKCNSNTTARQPAEATKKLQHRQYVPYHPRRCRSR